MGEPDDSIAIDVVTMTVSRNDVSVVPMKDLEKGQVVAGYEVQRTLGAGGCARVYEAVRPSDGRRVALKVLHADLAVNASMVQRFIREADVVNKIRHPNVADIFEFGMLADHRPYFFMEYLEGGSLSQYILQRGRLSPAEVAPLLDQLASALEAAHALGVVHRDVKGSNVMVRDAASGSPTVKLLDFGIAKLLHPEPGEVPLTKESQALGSPPYMAPEQIRGGVIDARVDIYALGVLVFLAVTGTVPFWSKDPTELMAMHIDVAPPKPGSLAALSPELDDAILKALEKDPKDRYATPTAFAAAFRAALVGRPGATVATRGAAGCGVSVEAHFPDDVTDEQLELASAALSTIEAELVHTGFQAFLQTAQSLLMVTPLPEDSGQAAATVKGAADLVSKLDQQLGEALRGAGVRMTLFVHVDAVELKDRAVTGGALTRTAAWPITAQHGWYATGPALERVRRG